jgi:hypothetical protein
MNLAHAKPKQAGPETVPCSLWHSVSGGKSIIPQITHSLKSKRKPEDGGCIKAIPVHETIQIIP